MTKAGNNSWPIAQIKPFLDYLSIECGLADNTILAYRRDLHRFSLFCLDTHLTDPRSVGPLDIQHYARFLANEQLASSSIARHLVTVRMFMRYHTLFGIVDRDICNVLETPRTWQRLPKVLNRQQTIDLITAIDPEDAFFLRDRALLELLYATGMRASEIAGLRIEDVNFQIEYLRCFGKGNKERIIPVHETALATLREYLERLRPELIGQREHTNATSEHHTKATSEHIVHKSGKKTDMIFVSRTGRPLSRIEIWRIVRKAAVRAGLPKNVSPHTLRHCFGSHLLAGGADLRSVQEMLGHADVATTQIYTHVDQQHLRNIHKKYHPRP
ncbi:MAG: tyrosine recombinase XerD [Sedimentisphaerales bacterium]|nr:tyrosine recombinase XerD [Sedimentisphaerales bacterium]